MQRKVFVGNSILLLPGGPGASEETFGGESSEYDFDESSDSSTRLPQESTMQPLNYDSGEAEISTAHFQNYDYDGGTVSSDGSIEEENRSPSIQESDSKESSEDESNIIFQPSKAFVVNSSPHFSRFIDTTKRFEETTTPRKDETTIYEHSGSGLNSESDSEGMFYFLGFYCGCN